MLAAASEGLETTGWIFSWGVSSLMSLTSNSSSTLLFTVFVTASTCPTACCNFGSNVSCWDRFSSALREFFGLKRLIPFIKLNGFTGDEAAESLGVSGVGEVTRLKF